MAFNISYVYEIIDKASGPMKKLGNVQKAVARTAGIAAQKADKLGKKLKQLKVRAAAAGASMKSFGGAMALRVTAPIALFAGMALKAAANLETLETSFESMLGSADKARIITKQLIDFTAKTPFQLEGVGKSAKQLLAFGVTTAELMPTLSVLGDISAGANVPLTEMAAIFGKVKAKGKAYTEELLQMSDRGIPIIDVLAKKFGVTKEAVFDAASKGKISFEIIQDAMQQMAGKGGIFFNQMDRQSKTLAGVFSTLKDNVNLAMASIGDALEKNLDIKALMVDLIGWIQGATKAFTEFAKNNPRLVKFGLIIATIVTVLGPIAALVGALMVGFALLSGPVLAIVAAVALLSAGFAAFLVFGDQFMDGLRVISEFITGIADKISGVMGLVGDFLGITGDNNEGSQAKNAGVMRGGNAIKAPGAQQEISGNLGIDINMAGNTDAVESVTAKPRGRGNLGMNMAVAIP